MPLSVEVSVISSIGGCVCGVHGALQSLVLTAGDATDQTPSLCSACVQGEEHTLILMEVHRSAKGAPSAKVKKRSKKQERTVMDSLPGGRVQPGSGSRPGYKGDGRVYNRIRVEMKSTTKQDMSIVDRNVLNKIRSECTGREKPIVVVDFADKKSGRVEDRWALIEFKELEKILNATGEV